MSACLSPSFSHTVTAQRERERAAKHLLTCFFWCESKDGMPVGAGDFWACFGPEAVNFFREAGCSSI